MGEYADMMLEGEACQWCGMPMDGLGFPGICAGCQDAENVNVHGEKRTKAENRALHPKNPKPAKTMTCSEKGCNRKFSSHYAYLQHWRAKHAEST